MHTVHVCILDLFYSFVMYCMQISRMFTPNCHRPPSHDDKYSIFFFQQRQRETTAQRLSEP